jgi:MFS family permease
MRRGIAIGTAVALVLEALAIGFVNWVLGLAVQHQNMSLAGLDPDATAVGSWVAGVVFALVLIGWAVLAVRIAVHDRMTGRFARIALIVCAVVHGVLGAAVVGLVGWWAFVVMMVILGLLVATLLMYAPEDQPRSAAPERQGEAPPSAPPPSAPPATA